jgi:tRNA pseudouridine55 synthase
LGQTLGCGGCMSSLRRIQAGRFDVANAVKIGQVQEMADLGRAEELLLPVDSLFDYCESYVANAGQEKKIRCGNQVKVNLADGEYRVYAEDGQFLMLGKAEGGILKTAKSFFEV